MQLGVAIRQGFRSSFHRRAKYTQINVDQFHGGLKTNEIFTAQKHAEGGVEKSIANKGPVQGILMILL